MFARHGVSVERWALADWVGTAAWHLRPVVEWMAALLKSSGKLFIDETPISVAGPGRGRTKTGTIWAMARDDRPWRGPDPPGVMFAYAPGRAGEHAERLTAGFDGVLRAGGYAGYRRLATGERSGGQPLVLAQCWSHARRKLIDTTPKAGSPVAEEALARIAALYRIETEIRGKAPETRRAVRQARSKPLVGDLGTWLRAQAERLSGSKRDGRGRSVHPEGVGAAVRLSRRRPGRDGLQQGQNLIRPHALPGRTPCSRATTRAPAAGTASPR